MSKEKPAKSLDVPAMPSSVHFSFGKKNLPKGFENLTVGQQVTLSVTGKVTSLNQDHYGAGFSLEDFSVTIQKKLRRTG